MEMGGCIRHGRGRGAGIIIEHFYPGCFELRNGGKISFIQPTDPVMEVDAVVSVYNDDDIFEEE